MPRVRLSSRRQITIPQEIVTRLGLKPGEELEVVQSERAIVLIPRKHIPKDQRWYYTDEWQQMMQGAFEDLKAGRALGPFETADEAIRELKNAKV